ncbi:hypothetical protein [Brevibacillus dissolubilis]|uniref:hypothetical protein n=1 Tax=Brevibacillus dissolubilis TaxID=1844116 RepID=UPI00159BA46B|nr:hypothetical protein [Brevibacillus dissolubilis]
MTNKYLSKQTDKLEIAANGIFTVPVSEATRQKSDALVKQFIQAAKQKPIT